MSRGFMYHRANIDVYRRYIVGWEQSSPPEVDSSLSIVKDAMQDHDKPTILNSDHGSQFTCKEYIVYLKD